MPKLTIIRGVSGSGKSTWASNQNAVVVSRDAIRLAQPVDSYSDVDESRVTALEDADVRYNLLAGKDVIVDDTNINWPYVKRLANIGYACGAEVSIKVFDAPLDACIRNNDRRAAMGGRDVPHDVIRKQYERFQKNKNMQLEPVQAVKPYAGTPDKPKAFMVDIDGTLAHMRDYRGPFDWKKVGLDDVDEVIVDIANGVRAGYCDDDNNLVMIVMSGRDEVCRPETVAWLYGVVDYDHLFMRPKGDMRPDNIVKAELFDKHVRDNFDVQFVLDDRNQVVDMWRRMGLTCLQVAEGNF